MAPSPATIREKAEGKVFGPIPFMAEKEEDIWKGTAQKYRINPRKKTKTPAIRLARDK
jgi:hypothetical protein